MPPWMEYLVSGLIGALGTAILMGFTLGNRMTKVESRLDEIETAFKEERDRTDTRIFEVVGMCKEILSLGRAILTDSADLRTTAKVLIQELREGRRV